MKEFAQGLVTLLGSLSVFSFVIVAGLLYSLPYSVWLLFSGSGIGAVPRYWWRMIDGTFAALGFIMYQTAIGYDNLGNVLGGEVMEDFVTHVEDTKFTDKNTTISASIGECEDRGEQFTLPRGKVLSHILNVVFNQRRHALDSWHYKLAKEKLEEAYFLPRKKG